MRVGRYLFFKLFNCSIVRLAFLHMLHLPFEACQTGVTIPPQGKVSLLPLQGHPQAEVSQGGRQPLPTHECGLRSGNEASRHLSFLFVFIILAFF